MVEMTMARVGALIAVAAAALVAALPAAAKEDVKATLTTPIPLDAAPGTELKVSWRLFRVDNDGPRQPFGAGGLFVRLHSASGAAPQEAFAPARLSASGVFSATVVVPEGGIGDIELGLMGWRSDASGTERADLIFPITNDPLPGHPQAVPLGSARPGGEHVDDRFLPWALIAAASGVALTLLSGAVLLVRARRGRHGTPAASAS
jgi:hypothetical protein